MKTRIRRFEELEGWKQSMQPAVRVHQAMPHEYVQVRRRDF